MILKLSIIAVIIICFVIGFLQSYFSKWRHYAFVIMTDEGGKTIEFEAKVNNIFRMQDSVQIYIDGKRWGFIK